MSIHNPADKITDAQQALDLLKAGNERFVSDQLMARGSNAADREALSSGQQPFAVVLCCSDSRASPEIYFDQKLGDIFVIRNAGNVVDPVVLGSIEYACEHLGSPLVAVIGHSCCGAVTAACEGGDLPENIQAIVEKIQPCKHEHDSVDQVIRANAVEMARQVADDPILQHLGTKIVPAYYDIKTGVVSWL